MVLVKRAGDKSSTFKFPSKEFLAWHRISETSGKTCILCEVHVPEEIDESLPDLSKFKVNCIFLKRFL